MTDAELDALEALYEEASPGPWEAATLHRGVFNPVWMVLFPDGKIEPNDAHLVVAMHEALPKLLAALRESRTECERQMHYGVQQHAFAQEALRARDAAFKQGMDAMRQQAAMLVPGHYICEAISRLPDLPNKFETVSYNVIPAKG